MTTSQLVLNAEHKHSFDMFAMIRNPDVLVTDKLKCLLSKKLNKIS